MSRLDIMTPFRTQTVIDGLYSDAARLVLDGLAGFRGNYKEYVLHRRCLGATKNPAPCVTLCPAGVNIPGYVALVKYGRYADAAMPCLKSNRIQLGEGDFMHGGKVCAYICHNCKLV